MKKLVGKLIALSIAITGLSGCDFDFSSLFPTSEVKDEKGIVARDYTNSFVEGSEYTFDGKVFLQYEDGTEEEVTKEAVYDYSHLESAQGGDKTYFVTKYEGKQYIHTLKVYLNCETEVKLSSIEVSSYSTFCKLGDTYTFDGKVTATYTDQTSKVVTSEATINANAVNTSVEGNYDVIISYSFKGITLSKTISVRVSEHAGSLTKIVASGYTSTVDKDATYVFDGTVTATYSDSSTEVVTDRCTYSTISTTTAGNKTLTITFKDTLNNITKTTSINIEVIAHVESISADESINLGVNKTKTISVTFNPTNAKNKNLSYTSNNTSIATVNSSGVVTGKAIGTTTINIVSEDNPNATDVVTVNVQEVSQDAWTVLIYVCGADLESDSDQGGAATEDLQEIASVSGQPDDVNVVVQAGGAKSWKSTYSSVINKDKMNRFHLQNKTYVSDMQTSKVNMGLSSSLQSFVQWGIETYPADNIGLILWNHGGAMTGCCFDEQYSDDGLTPSEVSSAIKAAKSATGYTDKFEFIGYDCCLMQVQDIAGLNSEYAKYQIASEESEWGYGWTYDEWIDDLFAKKSTTNILKAIVDSFKSETSKYYSGSNNDQTLSYLDLSNWSAYETAWESMASTLSGIITSSSKWSTLATVLNSCQKFGETSSWGGSYYPFDVFDIGSFCTKMKASSSYKSNTTLMNNIASVESAYASLVSYEWHGSGSSGATGMCLFAPVSGSSSTSDYSTSNTTLTTWRSICINYGSWY